MAASAIGKLTGKLVAATKSAPTKTGNKFSEIKRELTEGYREVIPAKNKD